MDGLVAARSRRPCSIGDAPITAHRPTKVSQQAATAWDL